MIVVSGVIHFDAAHEDGLVAALDPLVTATRAEPGCLTYVFSRALDRPGTFHVFEEWEDDASLSAHSASDHYRAFAKSLGDFGVTNVSIDRYDGAAKTSLR